MGELRAARRGGARRGGAASGEPAPGPRPRVLHSAQRVLGCLLGWRRRRRRWRSKQPELCALLVPPPGASSRWLQRGGGAGSPGGSRCSKRRQVSEGAAETECQTLRGPGRKGRRGTCRGDPGAEGHRRGAVPEPPLSSRPERGHAGDTALGPDAPEEPAERASASRPGRERARNPERTRHPEQRGQLQLQAGGDPSKVQRLLPAAWDPQTLVQACVSPAMGGDVHLQAPRSRRRPR